MAGSMEFLILAIGIFVGGHFLLSSTGIRAVLTGILGETGFRAGYSLVALLALVWTIIAFSAAPYVEIWEPRAGLIYAPAVLMPIACILAVAGLTTPSITIVGGESLAHNPHPITGITTITRHPFLWAVSIWAIGHIAANGDVASLFFFGGMAVLALGGMAHIDHRRRLALGAAWGPVALGTSVVPFAAALQGRTRIDWPGIGWRRVVGGVVLAAVLPFVHPWISGKSIIPDLIPMISG